MFKSIDKIEELYEHRTQEQPFMYQGKPYRTEVKGGVITSVDKRELPEVLCRVIPDGEITYDDKGILIPVSDESMNDMVCLSTADEWEKIARMFYPSEHFRVVFVKTAGFVGPIFTVKSPILTDGEVLALVPVTSICDEKRYSWTQAEPGYDYREGDYENSDDRALYQKYVLEKSRGIKPTEIQSKYGLITHKADEFVKKNKV
ncbi:hypothetical protein GW881_04725 [Candidatus Roizmanbacteria bacterium]|nr:hypothetical protein [Candidatus Roizmanbacteria bacterium]